MDEATVSILLKARDEGMEAISEMKESLRDLRFQAEETNALLSVMVAQGFVTNDLLRGLRATEAATKDVTVATKDATKATEEAVVVTEEAAVRWSRLRAVMAPLSAQLSRIAFLLSPVGRAFAAVGTLAERAGGAIVASLSKLPIIGGAIARAFGALPGLFKTFGGVLGVIGNQLAKLAGLGDLVTRAFNGLKNALSGLQGVLSQVGVFFGRVGTALGPQLQKLLPPLKAFFTGLPGAIGPVLISLGVFAALLVGPLLVAVGSATVVLAAFTAGLIASIAAVGLMVVPVLALGAAVILLGEHLFSAGKLAHDPLLTLKNDLGKMIDTWGTKGLPMALEIIKWLDSLVPKVTAAGNSLLLWFSQRMPAAMQIMLSVAQDVGRALTGLGTVFGNFFDTMTGRGRTITLAPQLEQLFNVMLTEGVQAVNGLLGNLAALSEWFLQRLPQMSPIVSQVMSVMGKAVQGFGDAIGKIVDWTIANWPSISKEFQQVWGVVEPILGGLVADAGKAVDWYVKNWPQISKTVVWTFQQIQAGWDALQPFLLWFIPRAAQVAGQAFDFLKDHTVLIQGVLLLLGAALAIAAAGIVALGMIILGALAALEWLYEAWIKVTNAIDGFINKMWTAIRLIAGLNLGGLSGVFQGQLPGSVGSGGGGSLNGPTLSAQEGGVVPGMTGQSVLVQAHAGEVILSPNQLDTMVSLLQQLVDNTARDNTFSTSAYGRQ